MLIEIKPLLASIGVMVGLISYIPYYINIFRHKTKPHFFTWFIWSLMTIIVFFAQRSEQAGLGSWITATSVVTGFGVTFLSLFYGEKNITRSDWISLIVSLFTIPLWIVTKTPLYSLILIIAIWLAAFYPTCRKSWRNPYGETLSLYVMAFIKFIVAIAALENYNLVTVLYPAAWIVMNGGFIIFVTWRRIAEKKNNDY